MSTDTEKPLTKRQRKKAALLYIGSIAWRMDYESSGGEFAKEIQELADELLRRSGVSRSIADANECLTLIRQEVQR